MTLLFSILVIGCILAMGWAFLAASAWEDSVEKLEGRAKRRAEADIQKGEPK
jgi:Tfp pilus assembly protein PilO